MPPRPVSHPGARDRARVGPGAERRRVSVLFADLENFTGLAESLDPEEVRAIQSRYFEVARGTVATYGGVIEKFIGDAVVAVWGATVAHEDDAERAVRAALDLVAAVGQLAGSTPGDRLAARAAVATGEAAVGLTEGQGLVSGDVVNTAARLQGLAATGTVLTDERTERAIGDGSELTLTAAGSLAVKGKASPIAGFTATLDDRPSRRREVGHTGDLVGRDAELRELVSLFDATVADGRGRMASIVGIAGIGKSRLAWELERAVRGRVPWVEWQSGGVPAYGESVAFAAVGEMVRRRCRIGEHVEPEIARHQLASALEELFKDADDRRWIEPRLAVLVDTGTTSGFEREELFFAWRRFFERLADDAPTVLVFEDLQWADGGLLDFIEHLGAWTRDRRILVLTLARPELLDDRPTWGATQRAFTALRLDRLPEGAMRELLASRANGIPSAALRHVLDRAGGVPLYAVELTRMLVDRGQLVPTNAGYRLSGTLAESDVPDSLVGLLAARLDALPAGDRAMVRAAATLGRRFSTDALGAVTGIRGADLQRRVASLVDRELLVYDDELRSPVGGQLAFVQDLMREIAYRTLSRAGRHIAHVAAAEHFAAFGDEAFVEATGAHLAAAYAADPSSADASAIAARARTLLREAARRALAVHAPERALEDLDRALGMPVEGQERDGLLEEAADAARRAGRLAVAEARFRELVARSAQAGRDVDRDRYRAQLASVLLMSHQNAAALAELESAIGTGAQEDSPATVELIGQLARANLLIGRDGEAVQWGSRALEVARRLGVEAIAVDALVTVGTGRYRAGDESGGISDLQLAIAEARATGLQTVELRARNNLAWLEVVDDPRRTLEVARDGGDLATTIGILDWAVQMAELGCLAAIETGDWEWALATQARFDEQPITPAYRIDLAASAATIEVLRGTPNPLAVIDALGPIDPATDPQDTAAIDHARAWQALLSGDLENAATLARQEAEVTLGADRLHALTLLARARLWARDVDGLRATLAEIDALRATGRAAAAAQSTLGAGLAALEGSETAALEYEAAAAEWRELGLLLHLALCLLESRRFAAGDTLAELRAVVEVLGAAGLAPLVQEVSSREVAIGG